jgi:PAS domain-containing protein
LLSHRHPEVDGAEFVVFTDPSRRYVDCTDGVCRLLGYERSEMLARRIENVSFHDGEVSKLFAEYLGVERWTANSFYATKTGSLYRSVIAHLYLTMVALPRSGNPLRIGENYIFPLW